MSENKEEQRYFRSFFDFKRLIRHLMILSAVAALLIIAVDQLIGLYVRDQIYTRIDEIPKRPYGVVLGTSKYLTNNTPNPFYQNRLQAAKALFDAQKINFLLLSGDNRTHQYNEPRMMARDLKKMGITEEVLFPDYAGFRTLDSIIRAKEVFKAEPMTIITQPFHCERALFIARYHNIDAICFAAGTSVDPNLAASMPSIAFSEVFGKGGDILVTICVFLFVLSTIIVVVFYGEKQAEFLFGTKFAKSWKYIYVVAIMGGLMSNLKALYDITDLFLALIISKYDRCDSLGAKSSCTDKRILQHSRKILFGR